MKGIFVTGTDTRVGKTVVVGLLAGYLLEKGYNVITQKWIQTGCYSGLSSDIRLHLKIMGRSKGHIKDYLDCVSPYAFRKACSPHLASLIENKRISAHKIIKCFKLLSRKFNFVIVEGTGGLLVPYNKRRLIIDIVRQLDLPVLMVVQNKLGAINHALLSTEALRLRRLKIIGMIFNNLRHQDKIILKDNPLIIGKLTDLPILGILPWRENYNNLYKKFAPLGDSIWRALNR